MILRPLERGDSHWETEFDRISIVPLPFKHSIGMELGLNRLRFSVYFHQRVLAPAWNAQVEGKTDWLRGRNLQRNRVTEWIAGFFGELHDRSLAAVCFNLACGIKRSAEAAVGSRQPEFLREVRPAVGDIVLAA